MKKPLLRNSILIFLVLVLAGCSASNSGILPTNTLLATSVPATKTPVPSMTATLLFSPSAVYSDETNGFKLDYPADWTLVPNTRIGSRGSQAQLFSPGTSVDALAAGGTRITLTIYDWDPKNNLKAYVDQRKTAFESSGSTIAQEVSGNLADGREEVHFILTSPDNESSFVMITTIGERYLQIAGDGNLDLVAAIANTLRP